MAILMLSAFSLGLPPVLPLARAASRPALVRSEIRLCSNSAKHRNQLEKQHACRCARIDIFCQRHHMDVAFFQLFKRFDELL